MSYLCKNCGSPSPPQERLTMATRSPGYNRLGLSIILSSLSPAITGDFFFLPLYPIPPLSATKSPALSCPSDCAKRERPSLFSDFILLPTCCAKRESFSLHTFFFLKKKVRSERPSRWLPFLPKAIARSASPSFRPLSCHQPVARSVRVFLCILSFFLKKKVWEIPTKYGIMERIDEHLFRAAGGTQFF